MFYIPHDGWGDEFGGLVSFTTEDNISLCRVEEPLDALESLGCYESGERIGRRWVRGFRVEGFVAGVEVRLEQVLLR